MKKYIVPFLLVLVMTGCFGSQTSKRYYQLQVPVSSIPSADLINRVMYVDQVFTDDLYDDFRMVYRISPFQINYYSYDFWAKKPGEMIKNYLVEFFRKGRVFKRVTDKLADSEPDLVLKSKINVIEEDNSGGRRFARLSMDIEIVDFSHTGNVYVVHRFDRRKPLPAREVGMLPRIISVILSEEMGVVVRKLTGRLK